MAAATLLSSGWGIGFRWRRRGQRDRKHRRRQRLATSAQYLPSRILQNIAHYVAAADNCRDGEPRGVDDGLTQASHTMAGVCRSWRVAVLALFYRNFVLDINCTAMWISPYRKMVYPDCPEISSNVKHLARSVRVTVPFAGVFNGNVVEILDANGYGSAVFPEVRDLWFNFYAGTTVPVEEMGDVNEAIVRFSSYVSARFPSAANYHFQVSLFTDGDDCHMVSSLLSVLVNSAHSPLQKVEYVHASSGVRMAGLAGIRGLTHISIQDDANPADCIDLVRNNAATLVFADLGVVSALDYLPRLTTDDDGNPITYPHLLNLSIRVNLHPRESSVAFPALECLDRTSMCTANLRLV
ncbi:hypothetical protein GGF46_004719 [Coemansia sp. RSA 552]|nr:hypothetical protein GGF46_004719 [Coemansia sp. RSA 552]